MKRMIICIAVMTALLFSCQKPETVRYASLKIAAQVVEPMTRTVTENDMTVYIDGENFHASYAYAELPDVIDVPVNSDVRYVIRAENITEEEAETKPDAWGQKRYAGESDTLVNVIVDTVRNNVDPYYYTIHLKCTVANSMLSVVFDQSVLTYYSEPKVTAYTDTDRKLEFTPDNAAEAMAHFTADKQLFMEFTGLFNISGERKFHMDSIELQPNMHYTMTFKMEFTEGGLSQPVITVDEFCEDIYETMTVDPSDNGVFDK